MTQSAQCVHHINLRWQVLETQSCLIGYTVLQNYATYSSESTAEQPLHTCSNHHIPKLTILMVQKKNKQQETA